VPASAVPATPSAPAPRADIDASLALFFLLSFIGFDQLLRLVISATNLQPDKTCYPNSEREIHLQVPYLSTTTTAGSPWCLGKRGPDEKQEPIWIEAARLATPAGYPFYERLNRLLSKRAFYAFAESACESFYAKVGRPGLPPGVYFRALQVGYFEGIDSELGNACRTADSLALRSFPGFELRSASRTFGGFRSGRTAPAAKSERSEIRHAN